MTKTSLNSKKYVVVEPDPEPLRAFTIQELLLEVGRRTEAGPQTPSPDAPTPTPEVPARESVLEQLQAALTTATAADQTPDPFRAKGEALLAQAASGIAEREREAEAHGPYLDGVRALLADGKFRLLVLSSGNYDPERVAGLLDRCEGYLKQAGQLLHAKQAVERLLDSPARGRAEALVEPSWQVRAVAQGSKDGVNTEFQSTREELERTLAAISAGAGAHEVLPGPVLRQPRRPAPVLDFDVLDGQRPGGA